MTDDTKRCAEIYLDTCALGYAAFTQIVQIGRPTAADLERWNGAKAALHESAVQYAAAQGSLDAAERAELAALRRFRDGVVALRTELAAGRDAEGNAIVDADASYHAVETIDALLVFASPGQPAKEPA